MDFADSPWLWDSGTPQPSFERDFARDKELDRGGTGPAITFTRASNATFFDANGVLQTASNGQPRFDHDPASGASRGLLIEEARTNSIRNSQAGGSTNGVIGSGGVMPTNWGAGTASGIDREVVGTGTQNGMAYIDVRYYGTNSSGSVVFPSITFESDTQIVASSSQTWTGSFYAAIVGGTTSGINSIRADVYESTSGGLFLANSNTTHALTSSLARYSHTRTLTEATTARVSARIVLFIAGNAAINLTLRIAAPQLEQGAFPTSYIPTTNAAATRSADSAVVTPISSFYNQSEGTLFAEATLRGITSGSFPRVVQFDEASSSDNRFNILCTSTPAASAEYRTSGVGQLNTTETAITLGTVFRTIAAVSTNNGRVSTNGALAGSDDTSLTMNSANTRMRIGTEAGGSFFTGHIRKIAYYPRRLSNALLQQLTT